MFLVLKPPGENDFTSLGISHHTLGPINARVLLAFSVPHLIVIGACCKSSAMLMGAIYFGKTKIQFWQNFVMDRVHKLCNLKLDNIIKTLEMLDESTEVNEIGNGI